MTAIIALDLMTTVVLTMIATISAVQKLMFPICGVRIVLFFFILVCVFFYSQGYILSFIPCFEKYRQSEVRNTVTVAYSVVCNR